MAKPAKPKAKDDGLAQRVERLEERVRKLHEASLACGGAAKDILWPPEEREDSGTYWE